MFDALQIQAWPTPELFIKALKGLFTKTFVSALPGSAWTDDVVIAHGFGSRPSCCGAYIACVVTDTGTGYAPGDFIDAGEIFNADNGVPATTVYMNATNIGLVTQDISQNLQLINKTGTAPGTISSTGNFRIVVWAIQF